MFEEIVAIKIFDPKRNVIEHIFIENAEEYNHILESLYVRECIIKTEKAYVFRDVPVGWKLYDCPKVYLTKEEKEKFENSLNHDNFQLEEGSLKGGFYDLEHFYYGDELVEIKKEEKVLFESQFENPPLIRIKEKKKKD